MTFEVLRGRAGFMIRRLADGHLYLFGFPSRKAAERQAAFVKDGKRFWVDSPDLVIFNLKESLMESLGGRGNGR